MSGFADDPYSFKLDLGGYTPTESNGIKTPSGLPSTPGTPSKSGWDGLWDSRDPLTGEYSVGKLGQGLGMLGGATKAYLGYQQLQLGKSQLEQNKKIFNLNFGAQAQQYNTDLAGRARVAGTRQGTDSSTTEAYIKEHSLKTQGI